MDATVDLTGGLAERYELKSKKPDPHLYRHILSAHRAGAFIACSRKVCSRDLIGLFVWV